MKLQRSKKFVQSYIKYVTELEFQRCLDSEFLDSAVSQYGDNKTCQYRTPGFKNKLAETTPHNSALFVIL